MSAHGWIKLHRSMFDNELWMAEPFTKAQAWIDLIGHTNHKPGSTWIRGIEVKIERGQLAWSELTMAKRWQWSRNKVRRYLKLLEKKGMAIQQTNKVTSILTICNYERYQGDDTTGDTTDETTGDTTEGQQKDNKRYTNKNDKNEKNEKNTKTPAAAIDYSSWPDSPSEQVFNDWLAARRKAKATHSQTAMNQIGKELRKAAAMGISVDECLAEAATRGWRGFKAEWLQNEKHQRNGRSSIPTFTTDPDDTSWAEGFNPNSGDLENL